MSNVQRYSKIVRGQVIYTGNTVGFSSTNGGYGLGAFLSTNSALSVSGFPSPSTLNWTQNGSSAVLSIPAGFYVEYAELVWTGTVLGSATPPINANAAVEFITPLGSNTIFVDTITSQASSGFGQTFYTRSQDVTTIVRSASQGIYTVNGVPTTSEPSPGATSSAGWNLAVIVSDPSQIYQSINFYVSSIVSNSSTPVNTTFSGFTTPFSGNFSSRISITSCDGNSAITGDYCSVGPTNLSLTPLFGPNNGTNNFFRSQINIGNPFNPNVGNLDTSGSFGNLNQPIASQVSKVRSGFDLTNVLGPTLPNGISSAVLSIRTNGDAYAVSSFAFQVDVNNALLVMSKSVDKLYAQVLDEIKYTFSIKNVGNYLASQIFFTDTLPSEVTFVPNSFSINGVTIPGITNASFPISLPNILESTTTTLSFKVIVNSLPSSRNIKNRSSIVYKPLYLDNKLEVINSNIVTTTIPVLNLNAEKFVDNLTTGIDLPIIYTIRVSNDGEIDLINLFLIDTPPNTTTFITDSVYINGIQIPSTTPFSPGIALGTLPVGEVRTVSFSVNVTSIPNDYSIANIADVKYNYVGNPSIIFSKTTNTIVSAFLIGDLDVKKFSSKAYATCNSTITYTFSLFNSGNIEIINILFQDTLPSELIFIPDSVQFNDIPKIGLNPLLGFTIPSILSNETMTLTFDTQVIC